MDCFDGYQRVHLSLSAQQEQKFGSKQVQAQVHRLVAHAFCEGFDPDSATLLIISIVINKATEPLIYNLYHLLRTQLELSVKKWKW